ncbi:MAG: VCBS repeat-containing protein [Planctomycetes bacterium]|nr:VCBS repeat-containing protein [Planctomycetota bacterium]
MDLRIPPELQNFEGGSDVSFRVMAAASLDAGNPLPDLIIPITLRKKEAIEDFVAVVLNPGVAVRSLSFYRTLDDPRGVAVANLNGDRAPDLLVACEGASANGNKIHLLFGDPKNPGRFFDKDSNDPDAIPPVELPGIEKTNGEVEVVATDNNPFMAGELATPFIVNDQNEPQWPQAQWIVASNAGVVSLYRNLIKPGDTPTALSFDGPHLLLSETTDRSGDPEDILVFDLFANPAGLLDLAILDEGTGELVFLKNVEDHRCNKILFCSAGNFDVGSPQGTALFRDANGDLILAVLSRSEAAIFLFKQGERDLETTYTPVARLPLEDPDRVGEPGGFAAARGHDGNVWVASLVEDGDRNSGKPAVDLVLFPAGLTREAIANFGSPKSNALLRRIRFQDPQHQPLSLSLGNLSGLDKPMDLAVLETAGILSLYPIPGPDLEVLNRYELFNFSEPLVDWKVVPGASGPAVLAAATAREMALIELLLPPQTSKRMWSASSNSSFLQIAPFWLRPQKDLSRDLYLAAIVEDRISRVKKSVVVERAGKNALPDHQELSLAGQQPDLIGAHDLNADGSDDLIVVDGSAQTLSVFLSSPAAAGIAFAENTVAEYSGESRLVSQPVDLGFGQFNGDAWIDVALGLRNGDILLFAGNGTGNFIRPPRAYAGPNLEGIRPLDLDGDGLDEIIASAGVPGLVILSGQD